MHAVGAIARYELLMAWRRRSLPILWLVLVVTGIAFSLLTSQQAGGRGFVIVGTDVQQAAAETGQEVEAVVLTRQQISQSILLMFVFNIALILMCAETIPLDHQFRVRPLLDALPITPAVYLSGKVIGVWLMLAIILLSGGALIFGVWRILLGAFDGRALLLLWLALALPLCWATSALTVLTAAFWGNRRRSILFGLLFMPAFAVLVVGSGMQIAYVSALAHPVYISMTTRDTTQSDILLHVGLGWALLAGVTLVAWTGVWALTRFLEAR